MFHPEKKKRADYLKDYQEALAALSDTLAVELASVNDCLSSDVQTRVNMFEANPRIDELTKRVAYLAYAVDRYWW